MGREKNKNGSLHKDGTFYTDEWWAENDTKVEIQAERGSKKIKIQHSALMNGRQRVKQRQKKYRQRGEKKNKDITLCTDKWWAVRERFCCYMGH